MLTRDKCSVALFLDQGQVISIIRSLKAQSKDVIPTVDLYLVTILVVHGLLLDHEQPKPMLMDLVMSTLELESSVAQEKNSLSKFLVSVRLGYPKSESPH